MNAIFQIFIENLLLPCSRNPPDYRAAPSNRQPAPGITDQGAATLNVCEPWPVTAPPAPYVVTSRMADDDPPEAGPGLPVMMQKKRRWAPAPVPLVEFRPESQFHEPA